MQRFAETADSAAHLIVGLCMENRAMRLADYTVIRYNFHFNFNFAEVAAGKKFYACYYEQRLGPVVDLRKILIPQDSQLHGTRTCRTATASYLQYDALQLRLRHLYLRWCAVISSWR